MNAMKKNSQYVGKAIWILKMSRICLPQLKWLQGCLYMTSGSRDDQY